MEGRIQLSRGQVGLELNAQTTSKRAESRYQDGPAVVGIQRDVPLRKHVVAVRDSLPTARGELWKRLADSNMEVGVHLVKRFAEAVQARNGDSTHSLVAAIDCRTRARNLGGDVGSNRTVHGGPEHFPECTVGKIGR